MPRRKATQRMDVHIIPIFILAVSLVFAFLYTVILYPIVNSIPSLDVKVIFTVLLVSSATVSSIVALVFYLILSRKI